MRYPYIENLDAFVKKIDTHLNNPTNQISVNYPKAQIKPWNPEALQNANEDILSRISGAANIYAIYTAPKNAKTFSVRYIGKSTRKLARQRIRNHLFQKHEKTGAKLDKVIKHVQSGGKIKISWVQIKPESLRNYVEEELIKRHKEANWNRENT